MYLDVLYQPVLVKRMTIDFKRHIDCVNFTIRCINKIIPSNQLSCGAVQYAWQKKYPALLELVHFWNTSPITIT